ncbi:hypothetical protein M758_5G121000 [Ceratodon purpureus]|nr:hypothetical protein M758_5G121000 [Ceratodon purpureus]
MTSLNDIGISALVNCGSALVFFLCFIIFQVQPMNDRVYHPKLYIKDKERKGSPTSRSHRRYLERYFESDCRPYLMSFKWISAALRMSEQNLIEHAGLDAVIYLRIYKIGLKIFVPLMIMGLSVIVTINIGGGHLNSLDPNTNLNSTSNSTSNATLLFSDIDKLSISNVPSASGRLWAHLVMAYIFTGWTCFILYLEYKRVSIMRVKFQNADRRRPEQFTVLVRQIPQTSQESVNIQVQKYFQLHHPDYYLSHQLVYNANKLATLVRKREYKGEWLSFWLLKLQKSDQKPMTRTRIWGLCGVRVDAIEFYLSKIENLNKEAETERKLVHQDDTKTMPSAFVSFKTRWGAAVCAQTQQNMDPTVWMTEWAPEPRDINWKNLAIPYMQLGCRAVCVGVALFVFVFCFMIPVAIVQSLASLEGLKALFPQLESILEQKNFASFVQGFLPGFILKIFMMLVPYIALGLATFEGHVSLSKIDNAAALKYYYFGVVNVFFGSILTGSAFQQLESFLDSSSVVGFLKTLALTIPMKATFFITYIMVDGWAGAAFEILRLQNLILYHIQNTFFVHTEADKLRAMNPGPIIFYIGLAQLQLYFLMGLVYSVITPIILPFIVGFFGINYVVYRHQIINVYDAAYESAGAFWPFVHGRIILALIIEHLMLIGLFFVQGPITFETIESSDDDSTTQKVINFLQQALSSTPFIIALPIFTYIFHRYCKTRFEPTFTNYPLEFATKRDMDDKGKDPNFNISQFLQNSYKHPDFLDEKPIEETKEIVKTIQQNVIKKKFRPLIQRNEKVDSAIDIPNMVQKLQT